MFLKDIISNPIYSGLWKIEKAVQRGQHAIALAKELKGLLAGGYARWCIAPNPEDVPRPEDCDLFFDNIEDYLDARNALAARGFRYVKGTLLGEQWNPPEKSKILLPIHIVRPMQCEWFVSGGTPVEILDNFDFSISCVVIITENTAWVADSYDEDIVNKALRVLSVGCPFRTMRRVQKYIERGFTLTTNSARMIFERYANLKMDNAAWYLASGMDDHQRPEGYDPVDCDDLDYYFEHKVSPKYIEEITLHRGREACQI